MSRVHVPASLVTSSPWSPSSILAREWSSVGVDRRSSLRAIVLLYSNRSKERLSMVLSTMSTRYICRTPRKVCNQTCTVLDGFFCRCGTTDGVRVSSSMSAASAPYRLRAAKFIPLCHQLIHPDLRFDPNSNPPSFASDEQVTLFLSCSRSPLVTILTSADHRKKHSYTSKNRRNACRCDGNSAYSVLSSVDLPIDRMSSLPLER